MLPEPRTYGDRRAGQPAAVGNHRPLRQVAGGSCRRHSGLPQTRSPSPNRYTFRRFLEIGRAAAVACVRVQMVQHGFAVADLKAAGC